MVWVSSVESFQQVLVTHKPLLRQSSCIQLAIIMCSDNVVRAHSLKASTYSIRTAEFVSHCQNWTMKITSLCMHRWVYHPFHPCHNPPGELFTLFLIRNYCVISKKLVGMFVYAENTGMLHFASTFCILNLIAVPGGRHL